MDDTLLAVRIRSRNELRLARQNLLSAMYHLRRTLQFLNGVDLDTTLEQTNASADNLLAQLEDILTRNAELFK